MTTKRNRLSRITTRTGDQGETSLATGLRISKGSLVVRAMGSIDELNSHIGVLIAHLPDSEAQEQLSVLKQVQQALFDMGAVFAMEGEFNAPDLEVLEKVSKTLNETLAPLTEFVLPGGGISASFAHVCRAVCRRAESEVWSYLETLDPAHDNQIACAQYLNRLSDYFFILARVLTATAEEQWQGSQRTR